VVTDRTALFSLEGRTAMITGASGFLGRTMVRTLLDNGAEVIAFGRSPRIDELGAQWGDLYGRERIRACRIDMYDLDAFGAALDRIVREHARIDVLVNNAHELGPATGFNVPEGALEHATVDQWQRNLTGGLYWPALAVQKIGSAMKTAGRGSIINIASMYASVAPSPRLYEGTPSLNPPGFSAAKAGLVAFTRYVASYWGAYGVRANAILPGPFSNTEETGPNSVSDQRFLDRLRERTALGRVGRPNELAGALLFLASDASSYVTGHALVVDGGWTII
jgi:gluconate 5-dehydrogenase